MDGSSASLKLELLKKKKKSLVVGSLSNFALETKKNKAFNFFIVDYCNILAQDRLEWRNKIHIADPK